MLETTPKLSVAMITYNHENYIEQAVRSVLMQETDFNFEIVIGEDCSTDRTREILLQLRGEYPDKIRLLLNDTNKGMIANFMQVWEACRGEFIATLEGDDYWTYSEKLKEQVDFLETNQGCILCYHGFEILDELSDEMVAQKAGVSQEPDTLKSIYTLDDLVQFRMPMATATALMRRVVSSMPDWYRALQATGDYPLHIFLLVKGQGLIGYLPKVMAVYRKHPAGVWSGNQTFASAVKRYSGLVNDYALIDQLLKDNGIRKFHHYFKESTFEAYVRLMLTYERNAQPERAKSIFQESVLRPCYLRFLKPRFVFGLLVKLYCPRLYQVLEPIRVALR